MIKRLRETGCALGLAGLMMAVPSPNGEAGEVVRCTEVAAGDLLVVDGADGPLAVALWGVDAPDEDQPWFAESRQIVTERALGEQVEVERVRSDGDRVVARITVQGQDLGMMLVQAGLAWLSQDGDTSEDYAVALFVARSSRQGMWVEDESVLEHPALWRAARAEENRVKRPVAAPTPVGLARIAGTIAIADDGEGAADVTIEGIASPEVKRREAERFRRTVQGIANDLQSLRRSEEIWRLNCERAEDESVSEGSDSGGSYWSESEGRWVSVKRSRQEGPTCEAVRLEIHEMRKRISMRTQNAVSEAERFGVDSGFIRRTLLMAGLERP